MPDHVTYLLARIIIALVLTGVMSLLGAPAYLGFGIAAIITLQLLPTRL